MEEEKLDVSEEMRDETRTLTSGKVVGPPKQDQKELLICEGKKAQTEGVFKGRNNFQRNNNKQIWTATKDMRVFPPNKGKRTHKSLSKDEIKDV
ncbi:hypothetical protein KY290_026153 [Solanum tuberosum]|uniref:Uncharacterized protein n=1 Tax=Solanum tuberosum TaxID=4113 RepID=A0ABQ7UVN5_SOLTU|nr:hypothetical protein KY289_025247 [Solanum tuberosum]KAH0677224.1 hypothetical protein KY285_025025 [Solanum tuberosum]KAH0755883.1 hypothetical protein KY290_026153 [Solanum tuberosum]